MTEAIKQWISDQSDKVSTCEKINGEKFIDGKTRMPYRLGLEKGIEIAQGFAEWYPSEGWQNYDGHDRWINPSEGNSVLTTSQLLEKYLSHLLNKENQ